MRTVPHIHSPRMAVNGVGLGSFGVFGGKPIHLQLGQALGWATDRLSHFGAVLDLGNFGAGLNNHSPTKRNGG